MIPCTWTGTAFEPRPGFLKRLNETFGAGEVVTLAPVEDRSAASHRHYFAAINEAWQNLPESLADRFPTAEHLRKWALIKAGYRDERTHVCASRAEAVRLKAFIRPIDDYAVVVCKDAVVTVWTAKSQNTRAMPKGEFQASKDAVLQVLAELIDVAPAALEKRAEAA